MRYFLTISATLKTMALSLIHIFTRGTKAPQAAGKIHTDFERGFIRAEIISYEDLMACGSMTAAKEKGLVRSEGKEYVMPVSYTHLFTYIIPLALFQYYPLLFLLGRSSNRLLMFAPFGALPFLALCLLFWKIGVRHYKSTGS